MMQIVGSEPSLALTEMGEECVVMNGYIHKALMLNKDSRRMDSEDKPDGRGGIYELKDIERKADMLILEVFDSGLIGEGAFHFIAYAFHKLLSDDATLLPMGATVSKNATACSQTMA